MAIQTQPTRIAIPFAASGSKNTIPDTNSTPSASQAASWTDGFPAQCSLPLSAGGIPPARADFNGILNAITQSERFTEEGGIWEWDATVDYGTNRLVMGSDGLLYWSVAQSGPNVGGTQNPTTDNGTYWVAFKTVTMAPNNSSKAVATTEWVNKWFDFYRPKANYWIDPVNGNDSNDGSSSSLAKKTLSALLSDIASQYFQRARIDIHLADGSYNEQITNNVVSSTVRFFGPSSGIASFTSGGFANANTYTVLGGRIQLTGSMTIARNSTVYMNPGLYLNFHNLGSIAQSINCGSSGRLTMGFSSSIDSSTIEYTGTNNFTTATINTTTNGGVDIYAAKLDFLGTATGKRYNCIQCSGILGTGSTTKIPGNSNGTVDSTSYYT